MKHELYIGDARDILPQLGSSSIHLAITSPPYWEFAEGSKWKGKPKASQSFTAIVKPVIEECKRLLVDGGYVIFEVADCYAEDKSRISFTNISFNLLVETGFEYKGTIVQCNTSEWQHRVFPGSFPYPPSIPVPILEQFILAKKPGKYVVESEVREKSKLNRGEWKEFAQPVWRATVGIAGIVMVKEFCRRLIRFYSFVGGTVLDPFAGTGTTTIVAAEEGRNSIGIELDEDIAQMAITKIKEGYELVVHK